MSESLFEEIGEDINFPLERPEFEDDIRKFGTKPTTDKRNALQG